MVHNCRVSKKNINVEKRDTNGMDIALLRNKRMSVEEN